ncbi:MAG: filamentous hemagglutinin N-terminal domain-containing protein [Phycisphaeraceae bacterium]|nr:filamentous hemagglutinin N-terminal domain-containing protein [Phycisphaeraceae bacterium]
MSHGTKRSNRSATRRVGILAGPVVTLMCVPALAGPEGERVVAGKARFNRRGDVTTIRAADRTVINYSSFDIAGHETVRFIQPSETARVLNRIQSAEPTHIDGALLANGIVYFVNRAGVYFGQSAVVDVGQIYAAAGNITNRDFRAGIDHFTLSGEVVNRGTIRGEMVALLGDRVANFGSIVADEGTVIMASGQDVLIGERGGHVFAKIEGANRAGAQGVSGPAGTLENAGSITAENGDIVIGAGDIYALVLHDASRLRAETIRVEGGQGVVTTVSGSLDASSPDGRGGSISVLGEKVALYGATVDASGSAGGGEVLIGGDFQGRGDLRTADRTFIDRDSTIRADATVRGDGGRVIVWSDEITGFLGQISARGGTSGGAGGFVEVSGKQSLAFRGQVDLLSASGQHGTLLLDPDNIVIIDGGPGADDAEIADGEILAGDGGAVTFTISEDALEALSGSILLQANDNITVNDLGDNLLDLASATGETVEFTADFDGNGTGAFTMLGADDTIGTQGADVTITANSIALSTSTIDTTGGGGSGSVTLLAADGITGGNISTGGGDISADANTDDTADNATLTINDDTTWDSGGGDIQVVAGGVQLGTGGVAQRLDAGDGSILVTHWNTTTGIISLGSTAGAGLHLSDAELAKVTAANLIIGADGATGGLAAGLTAQTIIVRDANITNISGLVTLNALSAGGSVNFSNVLSSDNSTFSGGLSTFADSSINIQPNLTTVGNMHFEVSAGEITVGPQGGTSMPTLSSGGGGITFNSATRITNDGDLSIASAGGDVEFASTLSGTAGGAVETITIDAGTGSLTLGGDLSGDGTTASATGLTSVTITNAGTTSIQGVDITGAFALTNPLTGDFTTNGGSMSVGSLTGLAGDGFSFGAVTITGGGFSIDNAGLLEIGGLFDLQGAFDQNSTAGTGTVELAGDIDVNTLGDIDFASPVEVLAGFGGTLDAGADDVILGGGLTGSGIDVTLAGTTITLGGGVATDGGNLIVNGDTTLTGALELSTGTGVQSWNGSIAASTFDTVFTGDGLDFNGGADSVNGTGTLTIRPADEFTDLDVGDVAGVGGTPGTGLRFGLGDINAIGPGFASIAFGFETIGEHALQVGRIAGVNAFQSEVAFHAPAGAGAISILGNIFGAGFTFNGTGATTTIAGNINTGGGDLIINDSVVIDENADVRLITGGGLVQITGTIGGTTGGGDESLTFDTGAGGVDLQDGLFGDSGLGQADATGLADIDFAGTGFVSVFEVAVSGTFETSAALGGSFSTNGQSLEAGDVDLAGVQFSFGGVTTTSGGFTIDNSDVILFQGEVDLAGALDQNSTAGTGSVRFLTGCDSIAAADADMTFESSVSVEVDDTFFDAGTGGFTFDDSVSLAANDTTFTGNRLDFGGGVDSVTGSGVLTIRPADIFTDLDIGNIAGAGGTPGSGLRFGLGDLDAIAAGFESVEFGWATFGQHEIQVAGLSGGHALENTTYLHAPTGAGTISILNNLSVTDANLFVLTGAATIGSSLEINTGTGGQTWTGAVASGAFDATFTGNRLDFTGGNDSVTGTGTLTIRPADEFTDLDLGDVAGAGGTPGGGLRFGLGDFAAIDGTFSGVEFGWATIGQHAIQVAGVSGGNASANSLTFHSPVGGGGAFFLNNLTLTDRNLTVNADSAFGSSLEVSTGTGVHNWNGLLALGGFDGVLTGNGIDFNGGADSVGGSGVITLRPADEFTDIDVGNVSGAGGTPGSGLRFGQGDINALADGFDAIRFGFEGIGEHAIQIGIATFTDSVEFHAPAGAGSILVLGPLTTAGMGAASVTVDGPGATTTLAGDITTNGGDIVVDDNAVVAEGASPTLTSNGGAISITGTTGGTTGGAAESLRLVADTGAVSLGDGVYGDTGTMAADATGLADFFIDSAAAVAMRALAISGQFSAGGVSRIGTSFSTNGQAIEAGVFDLNGTDFSLDDVTSTSGGFTIDNSGGVVALGAFNLAGAFDQNDSAGTGLVSLGGNITTPNANIDFASQVGLSSGGIEIAAGTAGITFSTGFSVNGLDATLTANRVDFNGGVASVTGAGGSLLIRPATDSTDIDIGNVAGAGGTPGSGLRFGQGDLMAIAGDFGLVEFGYETTGSHAIQIANSVFISPTIFHAPLGSITLLGSIEASGNGSVGFDSGTFIFGPGAEIITDGSDVLLPGDIVLADDSTISTMGGDIFVDGTINGDGNGPWSLSLFALLDDSGTVGLRDRVGGVEALNNLTIEGWDVRLTGLGTSIAPGVLGVTTVTAADDLRFRGNTYNANEQIYASGDEIRPEVNTTFRSNGFDLSFLLATTAIVGDVDGFQGTLLLNGSNLSIETDGGDLTFERGVENDLGAAGDADIDFDAGAGVIAVGGGIGTSIAVGSVHMAGSEIDLVGVRSNNSQTFTATTIRVGGDHRTEVLNTGDIFFDGDVIFTADSIVRSAGALTDDIEVSGTLNGAFDGSFFGGAGVVRFLDVIGATDPLTGLSVAGGTVFLSGVGSAPSSGVAGAFTVTALSDIVFTGGLYNAHAHSYSAGDEHRITQTTTFSSPTDDTISFAGAGFLRLVSDSSLIVDSQLGDASFAVEITGDDGSEDLFVTVGGTASFIQIGTLANGNLPSTPRIDRIEITANEVELGGDVFGNSILLQPFSQDRDIEIAGGTDDDRFDLTAPEIALLNDGFSSITIGRDDGIGVTTINEITFSDPVIFRQGDPSLVGEVARTRIIGDLRGTDDASFVFEGLDSIVELAAAITTDGQLVTINPNVEVSADSTIDSDGGDITVQGSIDGPAGLSLLALIDDNSGGLVSVRDRIGITSPLAFLTLEGSDVAFRAIGTLASAGILGELSTTAVDDNIFNGFVVHVGSLSASAGDENRIARDGTHIRTTGGDVTFTQGQLTLLDSNSLTIESNGGNILVTDEITTRKGPADEPNQGDIVLDADTGNIVLESDVGPINLLRVGSLTATGATISVQGVSTLRSQIYNGDTSLNGDLDVSESGGVVINGNTSLLSSLTISTPGNTGDDILLGGTVNGGFDLTLGAGVDGNLTILGDVGSGQALGHLQIANANIVETQGIIAQQLTQVAGTQSTTFHGNVVTDSTEGISLTGADFTAEGSMTALGGGDISILGDDNTFNGLVSSELGGVSILGDQIAVNGGASSAGDGISITGSSITLSGPFTTLGEGLFSVANAVRLTVLPTATFSLTGDFMQAGAGDVLWGTPELVALNHSIEFNGGVLVQQTTKFRARNVTFNGSLDADAGADGSNVNIGVGGVATISGRVGGNNPFNDLNVNEFGMVASLVIGNDINTDGRQRFEPPTNIASDSTLTAGGTLSFLRDLTLTGDLEAVSGGDASFFGPIDSGTSGPSSLAVRLSQDITPNANGDIALAEPLIRFFDHIGAGTALASISLNDVTGSRIASIRDGSFFSLSEAQQRAQFPRAATIAIGDGPGAAGDAVPDFTINATTITFGFFETLTAYANLFLIGDAITLADANIMGTLNLDAPTLNFRARPQGSTLVPNEETLPVSFAVVGNGGADLVVAGVRPSGGGDGIDPDIITVAGAPTVSIQTLSVSGGDVGGAYFLGVPRGLATPPELSSLTARVPLEDFARGDFQAANGLDRDLDANGISLISPATIRAVAIAAAESLVDVPSETSPGTAARDRLGDLGITIEDADAETRFEALIGRALYEDIDPLAQSPIVTRNRVDFGLVDRVLQTYANAYSRPQLDENGNEVLDEAGRPVMVSRADDIRRELDIAIDAYFQNTGAEALDPVAFNNYLEQSLDHVEAAAFLDDLRELLRLVGLMGLSPAEYAYAKQTLLGRVLPQISYEEFEAIVDRRALQPVAAEGGQG